MGGITTSAKRVLKVVRCPMRVRDDAYDLADRVSPPSTVFPSESHEGLHASEHPRDPGSVSSLDKPKAGDSSPLSERCVTRQSDGVQAKFAMLMGRATCTFFAQDRHSPAGFYRPQDCGIQRCSR